jgi:hypothetical protein
LKEEVGVLEDERGAPGLPEVPARDDRLHVSGASPWSPMRLRPARGWRPLGTKIHSNSTNAPSVASRQF